MSAQQQASMIAYIAETRSDDDARVISMVRQLNHRLGQHGLTLEGSSWTH